jgi:hypothetical protein
MPPMPTPVSSENMSLTPPSPTGAAPVDVHLPAPLVLPPITAGGISAAMLAGQLAPSSIAM